MKKILTIMGVVVSLLSFNVTAGKMSEGDYVDKICKGSIEYTICLFKNSLSLSSLSIAARVFHPICFLRFSLISFTLPLLGMNTGNINGCVLIAKNNKWQKYTDRALETIKYYNLPIKLYYLHN
jgi:hypothetical protein